MSITPEIAFRFVNLHFCLFLYQLIVYKRFNMKKQSIKALALIAISSAFPMKRMAGFSPSA